MRLSLLEVGIVQSDRVGESIDFLFEYAHEIERLGFYRIWLGEHFTKVVEWRNPEILLGLLCGMTDKIRIGSAGVSVFLNNPLRINNDFNLLNMLFPGRIDMGIARGIASEEVAKELLGENFIDTETYFNKDTYERRLNRILSIYNCDTSNVELQQCHEKPNFWVMGGLSDLYLALKYGLDICISLAHKSDYDIYHIADILEIFRNDFYLKHGRTANIAVLTAVACVNSNSEADLVEKKSMILRPFKIGSVDIVRNSLLNLLDVLKISEIVIYDLSVNRTSKYNSLKNLAECLIS